MPSEFSRSFVWVSTMVSAFMRTDNIGKEQKYELFCWKYTHHLLQSLILLSIANCLFQAFSTMSSLVSLCALYSDTCLSLDLFRTLLDLLAEWRECFDSVWMLILTSRCVFLSLKRWNFSFLNDINVPNFNQHYRMSACQQSILKYLMGVVSCWASVTVMQNDYLIVRVYWPMIGDVFRM